MRQLIVVEGFLFDGLIFGLLLHYDKSLLKVGIPTQIMKLLLFFLFVVYLLLHKY
jgi:hypothetical protein